MNHVIETMYARKSVRSYTGAGISKSELKVLLGAAQSAPVGRGSYGNLRLTVITDPKLLSDIEQASGNGHPLYGAPMLIAVSTRLPGGKVDNVWYSSAACVLENISLAATELGIGSCLIWGAFRTVQDSPELIARLGIPDGFVPVSGIILGKTEEKYAPRDIPENRIEVNYV